MRWSTGLLALTVLAGCDRVLGLSEISPIPPPFTVTASSSTIAAGNGHSCAIDGHGTLWCWGENDGGQIGTGAMIDEIDTPSRITDAVWTTVSSNGFHTCGLQRDGSLWCWGDNDHGKLGTGDQVPRLSPVQVQGTWQAVSAGFFHTCAIDDGNQLWCWGNNSYGELGDGTTTDHFTPEPVGTDFASVAAGGYHTCAIHTDGTLACWGLGGYGELGDGTTNATSSPLVIGTETWHQVAAGIVHTCGITAGGQLRCWGDGEVGAVGTGTTTNTLSPTPVLVGGNDLTTWAGVAANGDHTCAWDAQGAASCWGDSSHGDLQVAGATVNTSPASFAGTYGAIAPGLHHVCGIGRDGAVTCCGSNGWGQLGNGPTGTLAPVPITGAASAASVLAGEVATCVLDGSGNASCGGDNFSGQLGDGTRTSHATLAAVMQPGTWSAFAVGGAHACGIASSTLYCWGDNQSGQLGSGQGGSTSMPASVAISGPTAVAAGNSHTCAIDSSGQLYCWGDDTSGQLGDNSTTNRATPGSAIVVVAGGTWVTVSAGLATTCAVQNFLNKTGPVWCWGDNTHGQLGNNTTTASSIPVQVQAPSNTLFKHVAVGGSHVCAIDANNNAWCWGYNGEGQLGNGNFDDQHTPVMIPSMRWIDLELGTVFSCGLDNQTVTGLWCWGDDRRGELGLGDGTRASITTPRQVGTPGWGSVASGAWHACAVRSSGGGLSCWGADDDGQVLDGKGWQATPVSVPLPP